MSAPRRLVRAAGTGAILVALGGCASFSPDGGMAEIRAASLSETGAAPAKITTAAEAQAARERVRALLARPLTADAAVQIALLNNRGLQAAYNALGLSEAAFVEASLPPAPTFSVARLAAGYELEIERSLAANVLAIATLPARRKVAEAQYKAAGFEAIGATLGIAADTRRAYYRAVAARQTVAFLEQARAAADAAAELTRKLGETGAATKLDQARASAFYAEVSNQVAQARLRAETDREALTRLLGLWGADIQYRLPSRLPALPGKIESAGQVEVEAVRRRVDLIAARLELDATARTLGLTEATRLVSVLELAGLSNYERKKEDGEREVTRPVGFELEVEVPIFDFGAVSVRRAQETYMQAVNRLVEKAVNARSEARSAYLTYRATYDIARQYQNRILPLRKTVMDESLLQYNGMLIDVFDLLTASRETMTSNVAAIEARRDFFLAGVNFRTAIVGGGSAGANTGGEAAAAVAAEPAGGH